MGDDPPLFGIELSGGISEVSTPIEEKLFPSLLFTGGLLGANVDDPNLESGDPADEGEVSYPRSAADLLGDHTSCSITPLGVFIALNPRGVLHVFSVETGVAVTRKAIHESKIKIKTLNFTVNISEGICLFMSISFIAFRTFYKCNHSCI